MKSSKKNEEEDNWGYRRYSIVVKKGSPDYQEIDELCFKSKNLFNATLYYQRQSYFDTGRFIKHNDLNTNFAQINQPDYRALPAKVSKYTPKKVDQAIKSFWSLKKSKNITFTPKIPKYLKKNGRFVIEYEKDALSFKKEGFIKLSKTNIYIPIPSKLKIKGKSKGKDLKNFFRVVRLVPKNGYYLIEILYKKSIPKKRKKELTHQTRFASIDLGVNNLATVTSNVFQPLIINGRPIKSINQYYNKYQKKKQRLLPANQYTSKKIKQLGYKREMKLNDYLHKSAAFLVNYLVSQTIDVLVIGTNKGWKQNINIGKRNNQNFVSIPFYKFKQILTYLCEENGIEIHEQEESYTSKASFLDGDFIPTFTPGDNTKYTFSGDRVFRGLYETKNKKLINADVNGSLNILKKFINKNATIKFQWDDLWNDLVEVYSTPHKVTVPIG